MIDTLWPEKPAMGRERVVRELVQGQEYASQLQFLLKDPYGADGSFPSSSINDLAAKILGSFNESLSVLTSCESGAYGDQLCQNLATSQVDSAFYDDRRSEDSGESKKRTASSKDKRGCYKRKKNLQSWTIVSPNTEDGQAWRKYGQKEILNAKHPRSYFRCTRKYDQGCKATKQVQKLEDDPQMYHITYIGHHTCKEMILNAAPQILSDSSDPNWESCTNYKACSNAKNIPKVEHHDHHRFTITSSSTPAIVKQESKEDETPSDVTENVSSLDDCLVWKDLMALPFESMSSMYSCTEATSESFDMEFVAKSIDFKDCVLSFDDESEIFLS